MNDGGSMFDAAVDRVIARVDQHLRCSECNAQVPDDLVVSAGARIKARLPRGGKMATCAKCGETMRAWVLRRFRRCPHNKAKEAGIA